MNKREQILEFIEDIELLDEFADDAIIGYVERACGSNYVLYEKEKLFSLFKNEPLCLKEGQLIFTKANLTEIEGIEKGNLLIADGFNDAIIGYANTSDFNCFVIYDTEKCINLLAEDYKKEMKEQEPEKTEEEINSETYEMAVEYFYFNTAGAYMGEKTPGFATMILSEDSD